MASRIDDRPALVAALRAHPGSKELAALCRRVLDRIAETRSPTVSREFVAAQADELGVGHDVVAEGVRIRAALERGPESIEEWAVVVSFALCRIAVDLESGDVARSRKLVREADVLESLGVDVYSFVEATMGPKALAAILDAMVAETRDDAARGRLGRARAYARVEALRGFADPSAASARESIAALVDGTPLANVLGATSSGATAVRFTARSRSAPRSDVAYFFSLVSGFAFLRWLARSALALAGIRESTEVVVDASAIVVDSRVRFGDRVLRERRIRAPRDGVLVASRATRFPGARLLVGASAMAAGLVAGSVLVGDGVRSGETYLLLAGAILILGGGVLDVLLGVVWPASKGRAVVELVIAPGDVLTLVDVPANGAEELMRWVARG